MYWSSYSFYFQDIIPTHNITPYKITPFAQSFYMTKTTQSQAREVPTQTFLNSRNNQNVGLHKTIEEMKEYKILINLVKKGTFISSQQQKKNNPADFTNFLTKGNRVKYVQLKSEEREGFETKLMNINKKVKMLKSINDYIYLHVLKIKEDSIINDILRMKAQKQQNKIRNLKLANPNHFVIKDLYKQKQYHDKIYYYTKH